MNLVDDVFEGSQEDYLKFYSALEGLRTFVGRRSVHVQFDSRGGFRYGGLVRGGSFGVYPSPKFEEWCDTYPETAEYLSRWFPTVLSVYKEQYNRPKKRTLLVRINERDGLTLFTTNTCTIRSIVFMDKQ